MIVDKIRHNINEGDVIPKPEAKSNFIVKGWGERRQETALIYFIPNNNNGKKYEKGITESEWNRAYYQLTNEGNFTRHWFDENLPACAKEGTCNFTTIGGIFVKLGLARYASRGRYEKSRT